MNTVQSLKLIQKSNSFLSMIERLEKRIESSKEELSNWNNSHPYSIIRMIKPKYSIQKKIMDDMEVLDRLVFSYRKSLYNAFNATFSKEQIEVFKN